MFWFGFAVGLPPKTETQNGNQRIVTEWKLNEDGKKVKVVKTYKIETLKVSKTVAARKVK